jgi:hypothetical protein
MERAMRAAGNAVKGLLAAALLAAVAACGGTVETGNPTQSSGPGVVSGTISGTTTVHGLGIYSSSTLVFSVTGQSTTGGPNITFTLTLSSGSTISNGTYTSANASSVFGTVGEGSSVFQLLGGTQAGSSAAGTFTLTITDAGSSLSAGGGTTWPFAHGTLTATLPAAAGAGSGSVTLNATF